MSNESDNNLFDSLSGLGFDNLSEISVFEKKEEEKKEQKAAPQQTPASFVYERKITCPVCLKNISVRAVKTSGVRILSKDTDFMVHYQDPNPLLYDAWVCTQCGYASISNRFLKISDKQQKLIKEGISSKWKPDKSYPFIHDVDTAIEMHQLVLLNSVVKAAKDSEKAMVCLKIAWLYRIKQNAEGEKKFLYQAQQGFMKAMEKEDFPVVGLDESSLDYLIGELFRRLGDHQNALVWFGRVITSRKATQKIKDMARTQKDIIHSVAK